MKMTKTAVLVLAVLVLAVLVLAVLAVQAAPLANGNLQQVGNLKTHVYHTLTCSCGAAMVASHRVNFVTAAEAEKAGYRPCKRCHRAPKAPKAPKVKK